MKKVIIFLFVITFLPLINADVYIGTSEGYIFNTDEQVVSGATVRATVNACVVECSQETLSESTGYYIIANLNLPKNELLTVYAEKQTNLGLEFGFNSDFSNKFQAASINVTICLPPPAPTLDPEPNTHDTSITLEWTSHKDKKRYTTYDEYRLDSGAIITKNGDGRKSQSESGLSFSLHTWQVRTCNPFCCSVWILDSFNVGNLPPSKPNLTDQLDIAPGPVTLFWISGIDPDDDDTHDEYEFGIINEEKNNLIDANSPQSEEAFGINYYTWRVRTCETESEGLCSEWAEDGFVVCGTKSPKCVSSPINIPRITDKINTTILQSLAIISPLSIEEENELPLKISYTSGSNNKNIIFKINSPDFNFNDFLIAELENKNAKFEMIGKPKEETTAGQYNLILDVFINNQKTFSEEFNVNVRSPLLIRIFNPGNKKFPFLLFFVILSILLGIAYYIIKKRMKKSKKI